MTTLPTSVSASEYVAKASFVRDILLERDPALPVLPGSPVDALVVQNQAYMAQVHEARLSAISTASSLSAMVASPDTATDADVDAKVSDYFITRAPSVPASGWVRVVTTKNAPVVVPAGFSLSFSTLKYATTVVHRIYASGTPGITSSDTSRILSVRPDGKYETTIQVVAQQDGLASRLAAGTALVLDTPATGMVSASVSSDFSGGTAAETNQQLLDRALAGVTAKMLGGGNEHVDALVKSLYPSAVVTTLGIGNSLFTRDQGNILGISTGGKIDLYAKTSSAVQYKTLAVTGTVTNSGTRTVTVTLARDVASGIYRVLYIRPSATVGSGGNSPTSVVLAPVATTGWNPTLIDTRDASFTARHSITITWNDTLGVGTYTNGQSRTYNIDVAYSPLIQELDSVLTADITRPAGVDVLVKAGVPCITAVNITVYTPASFSKPAAGVIQSAIANKINGLGFNNELLTSYTLHTAVSEVAPNSDVTSLYMSGLIYGQDGVDVVVPAGATLAIPTSATGKYGPDNVYFSSAIDAVSVLLT